MAKTLRVALLGAGYIGQVHSTALRAIPATRNDPPLKLELAAICDQNEQLANNVAERYGYSKVYTDWKEMLDTERLDLFVNAAPNVLHGPASICAAQKGVNVLCEKPLASTKEEAYDIWKAVSGCKVQNMAAFMWRAIPAIRRIREMVQSGELGEIMSFRSQFLMNMLEADGSLSWRFSRGVAGTGAIGDLGSHHIDVCRFTVGEVKRVGAVVKTWSKDATGRVTDVNDDAFSCVGELENGAIATFEASRVAAGHGLTGRLEIEGSKGTVYYEMERMNELVLRQPGKGFLTMMVNKPGDPSADLYLPVGVQGAHPHGWNDGFTMQDAHMVRCIAAGSPVKPLGADMEDAYRVEEIVDMIERSGQSGRFEDVVFKT